MAIYSIYKITNLVNDKVYIGKTTKEPSKRFKAHCTSAASGSQLLIHNALRKYGVENFKFEVIFNSFQASDLDFYECHFIGEYQSFVNEGRNGYNMTKGGEGLDPDTARQLAKQKLAEGKHNFSELRWHV